jgi:TRAP-type uncharacterized transport system substrate-binding protein
MTISGAGEERAEEVRNGQADLIIALATPGYPSLAALVELVAFGDMRFLPIAETVLDELARLGYEKTSIPPKTFKEQSLAVRCGAISTVVIGRDDLPNQAAYDIAKALADDREDLAGAHAALRFFRPEDAWQPAKVGRIPLHRGAERFYREKGWMGEGGRGP